MKKIINNSIKKLKDKYKKKDIIVRINNNVIEEIIEQSDYRDFGARKVDKIIKNKLEMIVIDSILDNKKIVNIRTIKDKVLN